MRINIYQLDSDKDENRVKFCNYDFTQQHGGILPQSYKHAAAALSVLSSA